jgi:hypothetical protein
MTEHHPVSTEQTHGSLLEGLDAPSSPSARGPSLRDRLRVDVRDLPAALRDAMDHHKKLAAAIGISIGLLGAGSGAALAWAAFRPINAPDAGNDPLTNVLGFALLDKDFRKLPVRERLDLILQLAQRLQSMNAGDSVLVAAFAAGIAGEARAQLEENMRTLGIDLMADYAKNYALVDDTNREAFLDETVLEWSRMVEQLTGEESDATDEERMADMREQADRDAAAARRSDGPLTADNVVGFFESMQADINGDAKPNQRAQTARFVRDMTRHLRGRDIKTNTPKK